jgi:protein-S-isoprenylcysteine O-methyltransferase Ste14
MIAFKHLQAIIILPGVVLGVVPALILWNVGMNIGWSLPIPFAILPPLLGLVLFAGGLRLSFQAIELFATFGQGTLAPWDPPRKLVVRGIYRRVRNPMISGVFSMLLGEAIFFGEWALFVWFVFFVAVNLTYTPLSEERDLLRRFGADYAEYKRNVPRWIPRRTPWEPVSHDE